MKLKMAFHPGEEDQVELMQELNDTNQVAGRLELLDTWARAGEIEVSRWEAAEEALGCEARGAMHDLVEHIIQDRSFERDLGLYIDAGAELNDLVYAARRLLQAGQKVVLLDWDITRGAGEELLSSDIPVIDIHRAGDESSSNQVNLDEGRAELVVHQGADDLDWSMTVERAGQLMKKLEGVDVILFMAADTATGQLELEEDTVAMSASTVGNLAGAWGASVLATGGTVKIYQVLLGQLEMTSRELNR